ncbi:unnamed protein product, partial [Mesorhabditis belari]|uniref:glutathione gamma-glutamylcysteinyltransferase n=1 Tax=Mesorhabditis belari TaxID=2138241 RepID=A0AAF3EEW6_9BILA
MSVTAPNFYRRPLPQLCVPFASDEGKKMFTEALLEGNANIYFKLACQFTTQDEPAYCGPSSLVMCLNALEVDPGRVWKSPWRFYHESMLDCCVPMESIKKVGLNIFQMRCLANCNRLECKLEIAEESEKSQLSFRKDVIESVRSEVQIVVVGYNRSTLGQSGTGHFSPLGAYHTATDSVLILDVARFKYPPHWVPLSLLHKAMCTLDSSTSKNRGHLVLSLRADTRPLVVFGLRTTIACNDAHFAESVVNWREFLREPPMPDPTDEWVVVCRRFLQCFSGHALSCKGVEVCCKNGNQESDDMVECSLKICREIRQTTAAQLTMSSAVAALMMAYPYEPDFSTRSENLREYSEAWMKGVSGDTQNEILVLREQLTTMIECTKPPLKILDL